jgi:hypothetical protein
MWFLQELGLESNRPVTIFCDNKAAIQLANHPAYHPKTKHIRVSLPHHSRLHRRERNQGGEH